MPLLFYIKLLYNYDIGYIMLSPIYLKIWKHKLSYLLIMLVI